MFTPGIDFGLSSIRTVVARVCVATSCLTCRSSCRVRFWRAAAASLSNLIMAACSLLCGIRRAIERALEGRKIHTRNPERFTLTLALTAQRLLETLLLEWRQSVRIPVLLAELYELEVPLCILPHRVFVAPLHVCKS